MFILGHVGITLGAAVLASGAVSHWGKTDASLTGASRKEPVQVKKRSFSELVGLKSLSQFLDIRVLMFGSMLPDIVDKPLAFFGLGGGRSIFHTLLIFLAVLLTAFFVYLNYRKTWLLAIALGMFMHLILDGMWMGFPTLLWPLYGWGFITPEPALGLGQFKVWWHTLSSNPWVYISEGAGLAVILIFAWMLARKKGIGSFLLRGEI